MYGTAKFMLEDPCLMASCYWANVSATSFCYYMSRYHGFHYYVVGCCYGEFHVASYVLEMLVLTHFDYIPHRMVWPSTKLFLCLWHIHQTWLKQAYIKIKDAVTRVAVLRSLGEIMHNTNCLEDQDIDAWAKSEVERVANKLTATEAFWKYVKSKWLAKTKRWVVGN
jgi:hypothetical protein